MFGLNGRNKTESLSVRCPGSVRVRLRPISEDGSTIKHRKNEMRFYFITQTMDKVQEYSFPDYTIPSVRRLHTYRNNRLLYTLEASEAYA